MKKAELELLNKKLLDEVTDLKHQMVNVFEKVTDQEMEINYLKGVLAGVGIDVKKVESDEGFEHTEEDCDCPICEPEQNHYDKEKLLKKKSNLVESAKKMQEWCEKNDVKLEKGKPDDN